MSSYVFELSDVSIANGDDTLYINNSDSVFGVIPGSMLWIDSNRPRFVQSVDNTARTVTLTANWDGDSVINQPATIVPLPTQEQHQKAVDEVTRVSINAELLLNRFLGLEGQYQTFITSKFNSIIAITSSAGGQKLLNLSSSQSQACITLRVITIINFNGVCRTY